jgi:hypothetical protein
MMGAMKVDKERIMPAFHNKPPHKNGELRRLITAAVVSKEVCRLLLSEPERILIDGYNGKHFGLTAEEEKLILNIRASSLADFATQLASAQNNNGQEKWRENTA